MEEDISARGQNIIGGGIDGELAAAVQITACGISCIGLSIHIYRDAVDPGVFACTVSGLEPPVLHEEFMQAYFQYMNMYDPLYDSLSLVLPEE